MQTANTYDRCTTRCINQKRIHTANEEALSDADNHNMAQLFKAMGDANRLKVLHALEQDEMCVCDIAAFLRLSESAVSHQLRLLRQLKLVSNRRVGPILYYRLNDHHVTKLLQIALEHSKE